MYFACRLRAGRPSLTRRVARVADAAVFCAKNLLSSYLQKRSCSLSPRIPALGLLWWLRYPHLLHHHMDGVPLPPGIPGLGASTDPLEAVLGPFPCARLRGLPYDVTLEDILLLFQGLVVIDVLLMGAGESYVIFANPMDYQMALQR